VQKQYYKCGFNHSDENKFGQVEGILWDIGYHLEDVVENKKKVSCIYEIPP
jgi:hypothetical protein